MADDMKEYLRESVIPKLMEALQVYNKEDIEDTIIAMYTDSALCPGGNQIKEIVTQFSIDLDMEAVIYITAFPHFPPPEMLPYRQTDTVLPQLSSKPALSVLLR